jgi:3-hydroxymyristoyl/3-hydroxydecanoyl-(acyl carrier protein) dehydratase
VLPGVIQIHWAIRLGDELLGTGCAAAWDFKVKFRRIIPPGEGLELSLSHDRSKNSLSFEYRQQGERASIGRIKLAVAP